jgi:hypothetical protein
LPNVPAAKVVTLIKQNPLYHSVRAEFISAVDGRLPATEDRALSNLLRKMWAPRSQHPDLLARSASFLIRTGKLTAGQIVHICTRARSWWTRATLVDSLGLNYTGRNIWSKVIDDAVRDVCGDVALAAAWNGFTRGHRPPGPFNRWNAVASLMLRELGIIQRNTATHCGINNSIQKIEKTSQRHNWRRLFGNSYDQAERQAVEVAAVSGTNITAFVNALDVFDDLLVSAVFHADGSIGNYALGQIGSVLNPASRFARKYPQTFAFVRTVHEARYQSMYSHPLVRSTRRPTRKIGYRFLSRARRLLRLAIAELGRAGLI